MTLSEFLDFHIELNKLKKTKRYSTLPKHNQESTASHSWALALLALDCIEKLKLTNLDIVYSMKLALIHDIGEIGMEYDVDALDVARGNISKQEKDEKESKTIRELFKKFKREDIHKIWKDYNEGKTPEARYIKALDKIESNIHLIEKNHVWTEEDGRDHTVLYADKAVLAFPELKPLLRESKLKLRKIYEKQGFEWKPEYDKV